MQYRPSVWKFILLAQQKTNEIIMSYCSSSGVRRIWIDRTIQHINYQAWCIFKNLVHYYWVFLKFVEKFKQRIFSDYYCCIFRERPQSRWSLYVTVQRKVGNIQILRKKLFWRKANIFENAETFSSCFGNGAEGCFNFFKDEIRKYHWRYQ